MIKSKDERKKYYTSTPPGIYSSTSKIGDQQQRKIKTDYKYKEYNYLNCKNEEEGDYEDDWELSTDDDEPEISSSSSAVISRNNDTIKVISNDANEAKSNYTDIATEPVIKSQRVRGYRNTSYVYTNGDGYFYIRNTKCKNKLYLMCCNRAEGCTVRAHKLLDPPNSPVVTTRFPPHNHGPDNTRELIIRVERELSKQVIEEKRNSSDVFEILSDAVPGLNRQNILKKLRRRLMPGVYYRVKSIKDYVNIISDEKYSLTNYAKNKNRGKIFFQAHIYGDEGDDDCGDTLVFAYNEYVQNIVNEEGNITRIYIDSTITLPQDEQLGFKQLMIIHVISKDMSFPVAFCLMTRQTVSAYVKLFEYLHNGLLSQFAVEEVVSDYEVALLDALAIVYPYIEHGSSLFHYAQSIWRWVVKNNLVDKVKQEEKYSLFIKRIMALPYLPPSRNVISKHPRIPYDMEDGLHELADYIDSTELDPVLKDLIEFVSNFWLKKIGATQISLFTESIRYKVKDNVESVFSFVHAYLTTSGKILAWTSSLEKLGHHHTHDYDLLMQGKKVQRQRLGTKKRMTTLMVDAHRQLSKSECTISCFLDMIFRFMENIYCIILKTDIASDERIFVYDDVVEGETNEENLMSDVSNDAVEGSDGMQDNTVEYHEVKTSDVISDVALEVPNNLASDVNDCELGGPEVPTVEAQKPDDSKKKSVIQVRSLEYLTKGTIFSDNTCLEKTINKTDGPLAGDNELSDQKSLCASVCKKNKFKRKKSRSGTGPIMSAVLFRIKQVEKEIKQLREELQKKKTANEVIGKS